MFKKHLMAVLLSVITTVAGPTRAGVYDEGATDTLIKIGNVTAASGPVAIYLPYKEALSRCFDKINADGGVNGRKIEFISYDDAYNPAKTVEQTRKLVESDGVLFLVGGVGTPTSLATAPYLARKKIPHLFVASSASKISDAAQFPWMMGWQPTAAQEGAIFGRYMVEKLGSSKIGILFQNDDFGRDFLAGLKEGLGSGNQDKLVSAQPYEATQPTVTSEIIQLKASGADTVYLAATGKFVAQAITAMRGINWGPATFVPYLANSPAIVLKAAEITGDEKLFSSSFLIDVADLAETSMPDVKEWLTWMSTYYPKGNKTEPLNAWGWSVCQTVVHVLKQAGDTLTRDNIMAVANSMHDYRPPLVSHGISLSSSPTQHRLVKCLQIQRLRSQRWSPEGDIICAND
ncbi:branched-chain amino acid transport system substrate-binding protein [Bradyrhizobium sp. LM2.7]